MASYVAHEMKITFERKRGSKSTGKGTGKSTGRGAAKPKTAEVDFISMLISLVI